MSNTAALLTADNPIGQSVEELSNVTPEQFSNEILKSLQPVVIRGAVRHWPAVQAALRSDREVADYLSAFSSGSPVDTMLGDAGMEGHFFFNDDLSGLNFRRGKADVATVVKSIMEAAEKPEGERDTIYVGAARTADAMPGFSESNSLSIVPDNIGQRICLGSPVTVQAHFDLLQNVACLVAGRRRFTLFPPEQLKNLYLAPIERTLAGPPVSMVQPENPDFEKYPRFVEAMENARYAELEPGDVLYVPYFWWHHVQSFGPMNILVNYWWNEDAHQLGSPLNAMLHALLTIRDLPEPMREAWRAMFEHFVFDEADGSPVAHLPANVQGGLGPHSPQMRSHLWQMLTNAVRNEAIENASRQKQK